MMTISAVATAAGTGIAAIGQRNAMNAQADADRQRAAIEGQWAERRANDERATAQRAAGEEIRKAKLATSRLTALSGASGSGTDDQTVMDLYGDVMKEGSYNAAQATAAGEAKAGGIEYQAALDQWAADANARIKKRGANTSLIGGLLSATGQLSSGMAARYGGPRYGGYGRYS